MPTINIQISLKFHAVCTASTVLQNYNDLGLKDYVLYHVCIYSTCTYLSVQAVYCNVLCCTVLYCTVLHSTMLKNGSVYVDVNLVGSKAKRLVGTNGKGD